MSDLTVKFSDKPHEQLIIPFRLSAEQASAFFVRSISRNKFNSTEILESARQGNVNAVYFPVYIFDCKVKTTATALCTKRDGGQLAEFTAEREINSDFSTAVSVAGKKVDATLFSLVEPYELEKLVPFDSALVKDVELQQAAVSAEAAFENIKPQLEKSAAEEIKRTLKEYTDKKITDISHDFTEVAVKQVLLPLWVLESEYKGSPCRLFLNGQTGKPAGVPPRSTSRTVALLGAAAAVGALIGQLIWMAVSAL